jgi:hypothetical protein
MPHMTHTLSSGAVLEMEYELIPESDFTETPVNILSIFVDEEDLYSLLVSYCPELIKEIEESVLEENESKDFGDFLSD